MKTVVLEKNIFMQVHFVTRMLNKACSDVNYPELRAYFILSQYDGGKLLSNTT